MRKLRLSTILILLCATSFAQNTFTNNSTGDITSPSNWTCTTCTPSRAAVASDFTTDGNTWTLVSNMTFGTTGGGSAATNPWQLGSSVMTPSSYTTALNTGGFNIVEFDGSGITMNLYGNLNVSGATTISSNSTFGWTITMNIYGNYSETGTSKFTNTPDYNHINFANTSSTPANPQLIFNTSTSATGTFNIFTVNTNCYAQLTNSFLVSATAGSGPYAYFNVNGYLDCQSNAITGNGFFDVITGGTLKMAGNPGITSSTGTLTGAVRTTGGRTFDPGANYIYNGSSTQATGTGLPTSMTTAGGSVSINNTAGVTLTSNVTFGAGDTLNLINGSLSNAAAGIVLNAGSYLQVDNGTMSVTPTSMGTSTNQVNLIYKNLGNNAATVTAGNEFPATFYGNVTLNKTGATLKLNNNKTIAGAGYGNVTITNGTLNSNGFNTTLNVGNWVNNGIFSAGTNTVTFANSSAQTISGASDNAFYNLVINNTAGVSISSAGATQTIGSAGSGTLTFTGGKFGIGNNTLVLNGNVTGMASGTSFTGSANSILTINGSGAIASSLFFDQTSAATRTIKTFTLNRSGITATLGNALIVGNTLSLVQGTLSNGGNLTMASGPSTIQIDNGALTSAPTFAVSANVIYGDFGANGSPTTGNELLPGSGSLNNLTFAKGNVASETVTMGVSPTVTGSVTVTGGANAFTVAGNGKTFTINGAGGWSQTGTSVFSGGNVTFGFAGVEGLSIAGASTAGFSAVTINGTTTVSSAASVFSVSGTWTNNNSINAFSNTGTVTFNGGSSQNINGTAGTTFNNVVMNNASGITLGASPTISGNLTINAGTTLTDAGKTLTIAGNFTNNGGLTATGTASLTGAGAQTITGATTFNNLTINNTSAGSPAINGVTLASNITVGGTLAFTSGLINAGTSAILLTHCSAGNVTGAGVGKYVYGKLSKNISGCTSVNYEVGDNDYSPAFLTFNVGGTGTVTAISTFSVGAEPHFATSGIAATAAINKYWSLSGTVSGAASVTTVFSYNGADINGGSDVGFNCTEDLAGGGTWNNVGNTRGTNVMTLTPVAVASYAGNYIFGLQNPPTLVAQSSPVPTVDNSYTLTFTDASGWGATINSVKVQVGAGSLNTLPGAAYTVTVAGAASKIVINPAASAFLQTSGVYSIYVGSSSAGFGSAFVAQTVNAGVARNLYMSTQPVDPGHNGCTFGTAPVVGFKDQYSNITSSFASGVATVTATAVVAPAWTIGGTTVLSPSGSPSVCTFSAMTGTKAGGSVAGAQILFTATGGGASIASVTSGTFGIPGILSVSGNQCAGSTLSVVDPGAGGGTYAWSPAAGLSATAGSPVVATPSSNTLYSVVATYGGGCSSNATFSVLPTISVSPAFGCPPSQAFTVIGSGYSTYSWSPTTSLAPTFGQAVTANPGTFKLYTVTASFGGCSVTTTVPFEATPNNITGNVPVAIGNTLALTETATSGIWSSANTDVATVDASGNVTGTSSGTVNISYSYPSCGTYVVAVVTVTANYAEHFYTTETFPPTGWTINSLKTGGADSDPALSDITSGSNPPANAEDAPTANYGMVDFNSFSASPNDSIEMHTFPFDLSGTGTRTATVTFWVYRDNTNYTTATYYNEGVRLWIGTSSAIASATPLAYIPREANRATYSYSALGTATTLSGVSIPNASVWEQYTVTIPTTFNGYTNYLFFEFNSRFGDDVYLDEVNWTLYSQPHVISSAASLSFTALCGAPNTSAAQTFTVSAASLFPTSGNITATAPSGYVISKTGAGGSYATSQNIAYAAGTPTITGGSVGNTVLYVEFSPTTTGTFNGNLVLSGGGASYSVALSGTDNVIPTATITGTATICTGSSATLSVTGTAAASVTFSDAANITLNGSGLGTHAVTPASTTTYSLGTVSLTGCTSVGTGSAVVTVNTSPTITAVGNKTVCAGNNAILIPTVSGTSVTNYAITMSGGSFTGLSGSFAASTTPTLTVGSGSTGAGVYTGTLSVTSALSCTSANKVFTITVNATPVISAVNSATVCGGSTFVLTPTVTGTNVTNYAITMSGGTFISLSGSFAATMAPTLTIGSSTTPAGVYTGTLSVTTSLSCASATQVFSVTVNTTPVLSAIVTPTVCAGSSFSLNPTVTGLSVTSYTISTLPALYFTPLNGSFAATTSPTITVASSYSLSLAPGTYPGALTVSTGACVSSAKSFSVVVNPSPIATNAVAPASVCVGTPWTFIATVVATPVVSYNLSEHTGSFTGTSGSFASTFNPTVSIGTGSTPGGVYSATLTFTSALGCTSPNNNIYGTLTVNATPSGTITGTTTICNGSTAVLSVTGTPSENVNFSDGGSITLNGSGLGTYTVTPSVTTTYSISSVTSGAGCPGSGTGNAVVTVNATPTATITGTTAICNGSSAVLSVSGLAGAGVTFSDGGNITLNGSGNGTYTVTPSGTTTYTISSLLSGAGCSGSGTGSAVVTVNAIPTGTITGTTTICNGSNAVLSVSGSSGAGVSFSDGGNITLNGSGNGSYTVTPSVTTTYTISSLLSGAGCPGSGTGSAVVTVNALPIATLTGTTSICIGSMATLNIAGSAGATINFSDGGNTVLDGSGNGTYTVAPVTNTTYTITSMLSGAGCTGGAGTGSAVITVNALPTATITGTATICNGSATVLTATGNPNAIVTFSDGGIFTLDFAGVYNYTVSPSVTTDYTITNVENLATGCSQAGTGDALITVNPIPTATVSGTTTICTGSNAVLSVAGTAGAGITFSDGGNISLDVSGNGSYSVTPSLSTTYTITTVSLSGCSQAGTGSAIVTVNAIPTATVSGTTTLCAGSSATLTVTGSAGAGITFSDAGSITLDGSGNGNYVVTPPLLSMPVTYTISNVSLNGCSQAGSGSAVITVNAMPTATVSGTTTICSGASAVLTVAGSANAGVAFSDGGNITLDISGNGAYTVTPVSTTTYNITVSNLSTGCSQAGTGSAVVTVNALPTATITGTMSICNGSMAILPISGTAGATVNISDGGNVVLDGSGNGNYSVTPISTSTYTITSVVAGCTGSGSGSAVVTVISYATASISPVPTSCAGYSTAVTFHGTPSAVVSYSVTGGSTLTGTLNGGTGNYAITIPPTTTATVTLISVTNGGICYTGINTTATVAPTSNTWLGTSGSNWATSGNWSCGFAPNSGDPVVIPSTATQPVISSGATGNAGNLTIASGAIVTIQSTGNLNVTGNLSSNGIVTGAGTLSLVGTSAQTLSGYASVGNIKLNNSHGAVMNSIGDSLFINGLLTLTSGTLTTSGNGNVVIVTDSNGTSGQIGTIPPGGGSISGNVTMKQYIRFGHRAYRFWGHPFTVSIPLSQLENYIDISGTGGTTNGFTHTITDAPTAFWYDNRLANAALSLDPGWIDFKTCNSNPANPADTNNFKQFEGIRILDRGYKGQGLDGVTYTPGTSIVGDYGPVNMGNQNIPIKNYGTGKAYNTISNPYPSPVDIGTVIFNAAQAGRILGNMFYVWDPYLSTAGAYANIAFSNTMTATAIPFYIAPNTSFQVRAIGSASVTPVYLNFTEANKGTAPSAVPGTSVPGDLRSVEAPGYTMLTVYDNNYHPYDMWYMNFNGEATEGEDEKLDAGKPVNPDLNFYSWSADNTKLAADARPYEAGKVIPLGFFTDLAQTYIIKVSSFAAPDGAQVYLHDKLMNTYTKLEQGAEYKFNITTDARTQGDARFEISLDPTGIAQPEIGKMVVSMTPNPTNDEVNISFSTPKAGNTTIRVVDITGVCVYSDNLGAQQSGKVSVSLAGFASGIYMVEVTNGDNKVVQRLVKE